MEVRFAAPPGHGLEEVKANGPRLLFRSDALAEGPQAFSPDWLVDMLADAGWKAGQVRVLSLQIPGPPATLDGEGPSILAGRIEVELVKLDLVVNGARHCACAATGPQGLHKLKIWSEALDREQRRQGALLDQRRLVQ